LHAVRFLTTFRIPSEVHADIEAIIQRVIDEEEAEAPPDTEDDEAGDEGSEAESEEPEQGDSDGSGSGPDPGQSQDEDTGSDNEEDSKSSEEQNDADSSQSDNSHASSSTGESSQDSSASSTPSNEDNLDSTEEERDDASRDSDAQQAAQGEASGQGEPDEDAIAAAIAAEQVGDLRPLLSVLKGRIDRGLAEFRPHRGGHPRSYQRLENFDDFGDVDAVEALLWNDNPQPLLPRVYRRSKIESGGAFAVLRDTSMSMSGVWNNWASSLVYAMTQLAQSKRMKMGYIEFNHRLTQYTADDEFFVRDYDALTSAIFRAKCEGVTDYQLPISTALREFQKLPTDRNNHHILFLTDGLPTAGDRHLVRELALARTLGVSIHSVFIGYQTFPTILQRLSDGTGGYQFMAFMDSTTGKIQIQERQTQAVHTW